MWTLCAVLGAVSQRRRSGLAVEQPRMLSTCQKGRAMPWKAGRLGCVKDDCCLVSFPERRERENAAAAVPASPSPLYGYERIKSGLCETCANSRGT